MDKNKTKKKSSLGRVWLLTVGFATFALILVGRLYFVQIVRGEEYKDRANNQYFKTPTDVFNRGSIFFQNKDGSLFPAAVQKTGFTLSVNPGVISDYDFLFEQLRDITELDKEEFDQKMKRGGDYQELATRLDTEAAEKIRKLNLLGVSIQQEKWRYYPADSLASHLIGIVAYQEDELAGRYGLERYYENILKREDQTIFANFFAEVFSNVKSSVGAEEVQNKEGDVVVSIDPQVQSFLEEKLRLLNEEWGSSYSGGIVIDPKTGEIFAIASEPDFNPNDFKNEPSISIFKNPLVENVYEMGSIIKSITMASGLDSGVVTPESVYFDAGTLSLNGKQISNFDGRGRGLVNMQEVLNQSLNTGAAFVASQIGNEKFADYMFKFGLGEETGIDLPNEASNLVSNLNAGRDLEIATASFGQGIAMTPISTVRALSVLANGGVLISPHLIKSVDYKSGFSRKISYENGRQVISKEASEDVTRMLVNVVDEALVGGKVKLPNYSIAAKTGTAQIANQQSGGYYDDRYLHTFFGYFPAFDPRFLVFLFTYYPKNVRYASETLTNPFIELTKYLINYYEIPPDR